MMQQFTFVNFQELIRFAYSLEIYDNTQECELQNFSIDTSVLNEKRSPGSYLLYIGDEKLPNYMGVLS